MATIEPYTPKSGWFWRWTRQAIALSPRLGEAAFVFMAGAFASGLVSLFIFDGLTSLIGPHPVSEDIARIAGMATALPILLVIFALVAKADLGSGVDWGHLRALLPQGLITLCVVAIAVSAFTGLVFGFWFWEGKPSFAEAMPGGTKTMDPLPKAFFTGLTGMANVLILQIVFGILSLPFVVGFGAGWDEARAFHRLAEIRIPKIMSNILWITFGFTILSQALDILGIGVAILFLLVLWLYVGAREIAGGITENGKTHVTTPHAAPDAA